MKQAPDIAIIGAGLGGLLLARTLLARGVRATLYERRPSLSEPTPLELRRPGDAERLFFGPTGKALLRHFLPQGAENTFVQADPLVVLHPGGKRLLHLPTDADSPYAAFMTPRDQLLVQLAEELPEEAIVFGAELTGLTSRGGAATLSFKDGREVVADAVVGADGAQSTLRQLAWSDPLRYWGLLLIEGRVPHWGGSALPLEGQTLTLGRGTSFWLRRSADGAGLTWTFSRSGRRDSLLSHGPESLRGVVEREIADWHAPLQAVLASTPDETLRSLPLMGRSPPDPLFRDAAVLIGSAAHGCGPFLVPPTDATIADAVELGEALASASITTLGLRFRRYATAAHPRGVTAVTRGEWNGRLLHASTPLGRSVRDSTLRMLGAGVERSRLRLSRGRPREA